MIGDTCPCCKDGMITNSSRNYCNNCLRLAREGKLCWVSKCRTLYFIRCSKCGEWKPFSEFSPGRTSVTTRCKVCNSKRAGERYRNFSPEQRKKRLLRSRILRNSRIEEARKRDRETARRYRAANKEHCLEYQRKWKKSQAARLDDAYLKELLNLKNPPAELLEAKRVAISIKRYINEKRKRAS
jgi:hypothetical protein